MFHLASDDAAGFLKNKRGKRRFPKVSVSLMLTSRCLSVYFLRSVGQEMPPMVGFGTVGLEDGGIKPSMTKALSSGIAIADTAEASEGYPQ